MIKNILFDLDGTLLPMEQEVFVKSYFKTLAEKMFAFGYEPKKLVSDIHTGMKKMIKNNSTMTNEKVFWDSFYEIYGEKIEKDKPVFEEYYRVEFQHVASDCGYNSASKEIVETLKEMGFRLVLATNPLFPAIATESRIRWAGLSPDDFELFTTYEASFHCKPNPEYYCDIIKQLQLNPEECLMVGNDVDEDMIAQSVGINVFLLTDCLINKSGKDISAFPNGGFAELLEYIIKNK